MELRIRIPQVFYCSTDGCYVLTACTYCIECRRKQILDTWMRKEVTTTTFTRQSQVGHRTPLRRYLSG